MKLNKQDLLLYVVTDRTWLNGGKLEDQVEAALQGGATFVQLREKELDETEFLKEAQQLKTLCHGYGVPFVINDNVDIAAQVNADGVHVGQDDLDVATIRNRLGFDKIIGVSVHTVAQALQGEEAGADYLGVGAMFPTSTKTDANPVSYQTLQAICQAVSIPVVAIGGIGAHNIDQLAGSGICGAAVVSAIFAAHNIKEATVELKELTTKAVQPINHKILTSRRSNNMKTALTIAGSDSCGGAGIQADLKTMTTNGVYAMSAITALTAQNTTGVSAIFEVPGDFLASQIDAVFTDIRPDAIKIGMVASATLIDVIAAKLQFHQARNIVVDPVMVATSGAILLQPEALKALTTKLLPLATVVTPNIPEAKILAGMDITTKKDMVIAAKIIADTYNCAVLLKGGHNLSDANDLLYANKNQRWFFGHRIATINTHGTGCTLSSAIAANLAKGFELDEAIRRSKSYISGALGAMLDLGAGSGPLNHAFDLESKFAQEEKL